MLSLEKLDSHSHSAHSTLHPVMWAIRHVNRKTSFRIPSTCNPCLLLHVCFFLVALSFRASVQQCPPLFTLVSPTSSFSVCADTHHLKLQLEWSNDVCFPTPTWNASLTALSKRTMICPKRPFKTHLYSINVSNKLLIYENIHKSSKSSLPCYPEYWMVEFSTQNLSCFLSP